MSAEDLNGSTRGKTITEQLAPYVKWWPGECELIEKYRVAYERQHGPTDMSANYTTRLPWPEQVALRAHDFAAWRSGVPPYLLSYLVTRDSLLKYSGSLDNLPDDQLEITAMHRHWRATKSNKLRLPEP